MDIQQTVDDVRRCCHFNAMYIDEYIGRSVPDDELAFIRPGWPESEDLRT